MSRRFVDADADANDGETLTQAGTPMPVPMSMPLHILERDPHPHPNPTPHPHMHMHPQPPPSPYQQNRNQAHTPAYAHAYDRQHPLERRGFDGSDHSREGGVMHGDWDRERERRERERNREKLAPLPLPPSPAPAPAPAPSSSRPTPSLHLAPPPHASASSASSSSRPRSPLAPPRAGARRSPPPPSSFPVPTMAPGHPNANPASRPRSQLPTYTLLAAGSAGCGKTSLLRLLLDTLAIAPSPSPTPPSSSSLPQPPSNNTSASAAAAASCARFVAGAVAGGRTTHVRECEVDVCLPGAGIEAELFGVGGNLPGYGGYGGKERKGDVDEGLGRHEGGEVVRLHLIDTPGLDTSSPVALDRSLADVLRVIEARFEESLEDVRDFILFFHSIYLSSICFHPHFLCVFPSSIGLFLCAFTYFSLLYKRLKNRSEVHTD